MFYPKNIATKLSFDLVLDAARVHCATSLGLAHFDRLKCSIDLDQVNLWLTQTAEIVEIIGAGDLPLNLELDFDLQYSKAKIEGFFYEVETIRQIADVISALQDVLAYIAKTQDKYPKLVSLFMGVDVDFDILEDVNRIISTDGEIKSSASPALAKIINAIGKAEKNILSSSNSLFNKAKDSGLLGDTEIGIKNGRMVLPVLSEYKRKVKGVLIDQSNTGKISYIEPLELVSLNNELSELHIKKRQEIVSILKKLTAKIVLSLDDIRRGIVKLSVYDFVRAKARLASEWRCIHPNIGKQTNVTKAKHPLLEQRLRQETKEIVPIDYNFNDEQKLIVISGPNAGGKSVSLKTVGLLQYMLQSGFLVPCDSTSTFRVYQKIFIDIGDDQSIESDLSTYSSHLKSAKHIINFCDSETMVLMDEIGTGTDPMFGGPMAEAILEVIHHKEAQGIITTHFSNIKAKADKLEGVVNAAMLFDIDKLLPMYKLQIGQPGSSFAYEVAANIGLNKKLIKRAKALTNTKQYDLDALLAEVQSEQEKVRSEQIDLNKRLSEAQLIEREYKALKQEIEGKKKDILEQAKYEAQGIIENANKEIEKTIRLIKESNADKNKTQKARKALESNLESKEVKIEKEKPEFKVGDRVQIEDTNSIGEIVEIKKNKATLQVGSITTKTNISKLDHVGRQTEKVVKKHIGVKSYMDKQFSFKAEKDVRGMRTYDALQEIDSWVDSAIILGINSLRVLHGKGNGILKNEIRRHLKHNSAIKSIRYERVELGGEGISIIELK